MKVAGGQAVVVAGMHRSGTSMVGGMLARCGVDMGRRLVPADAANARGYFEDADIVAFHGRMFRQLLPEGAAGHVDWGWCEAATIDDAALLAFEPEARALVDARAAGAEVWGFKDPRAAVTLDLWDRCIEDARFVLVYRFPWEVADSMQRGGAGVFLRNPSYAYRIWAHYNARLLAFYERHRARCVLVCSNTLAEDLASFQRLLHDQLGLEPRDVDLSEGFDRDLFTAGEPDDPRAALVDAAYPECTALLRRLDDAAHISGAGAWCAQPAARPTVARPGDDGEVDVSIVVPTYGDGVLLLDALASVERCRPPATELVIVNDGSRDPETRRILGALRGRGWHVVDKANGGLSSARNVGIAQSRGRYILPLDADNRLRPGFVEAAVAALDSDPQVGVVYGDRQLFGVVNKRLPVAEFDLPRMLGGNYIDACAMHRRALWQDVGRYDEAMSGLEDWEYWLRASLRGWRFLRLDRIAFDYRVRPGSLIAVSLQTAKRRELMGRVLHKHGATLHAHTPRLFRAPSAMLGWLLPRSWRARLVRGETSLFWRPFWWLFGAGGLLSADRQQLRARR